MPADDQVTSLTGVGGSAQNGAVAFATTHWSVVLTAQDQTPESDVALEKLGNKDSWGAASVYFSARRERDRMCHRLSGADGISAK